MFTLLILIILFLLMRSYSSALDKFTDKFKNHRTFNYIDYGLISRENLSNLTIDEFSDWCCKFLVDNNFKSVFTKYKSYENDLVIINCVKNYHNYKVLCKLSNKKTNSTNKFETVPTKDIFLLIGNMLSKNITHGAILTTGTLNKESSHYLNSISNKYCITCYDGLSLVNAHHKIRDKKISLLYESEDYSYVK